LPVTHVIHAADSASEKPSDQTPTARASRSHPALADNLSTKALDIAGRLLLERYILGFHAEKC
jgi:hypothetical protein